MSTFADIPLSDIREDCRFYSGYKPCHRHATCRDCPRFEARGEQILVIKLGAMGDVLRTKAILPALKRSAPQSWIVWLTNPGSEPLARDPLVDEVRALTMEGVLALEGRRFARLYCLDKDSHAVALAGRLTADKKFGFGPTAYNTIRAFNAGAAEGLRLGLSDELKFRINRKTMPEIVAEVCELPYAGERYTLSLSEDAKRRAAETVRALELPTGRIIGLNTGCGPVFATKAWTTENMIAFCRLAAESTGHSILLLGGAREAPIHAEIAAAVPELMGRRVFDSGTNHALEPFLALAGECDVVLSADSLAMHAAIALGKPVVAWFGPTAEQEVGLFGNGEKLVTDFACAPCYLKSCPKPVFCLSRLRPEDVLAAAERALAR